MPSIEINKSFIIFHDLHIIYGLDEFNHLSCVTIYKTGQCIFHNTDVFEYYKIVTNTNDYLILQDICKILSSIIFPTNTNFDINVYYLNKNIINIVIMLINMFSVKFVLFGKQISNINFPCLKKLSNVEKLNLQFVSRRNNNLNYLPDNLESITLFVNQPVTIFHMQNLVGLKKLIISSKYNKYEMNISNISGINNLLFINSNNIVYNNKNNNKYDCEYIIITGTNPFNDIVLNYISLHVKVIHIILSDSNRYNLDYNVFLENKSNEINILLGNLPNSVEKIIFDGIVNFNLCDLPSSVKTIVFNNSKIINMETFNQIPDFVEYIYIKNLNKSYYNDHTKENILINKIPKMLKKIVMDKENDHLFKLFSSCKKKSFSIQN
jgi:hypothetical protein